MKIEFPSVLKNIQYIDFTDNKKEVVISKNDKTDFDEDIDDIIKILETDSEYIQRHKIVLTQALKWERQDKNPSMLLRGHNLEQAKVWLKIGQKRDINIPLSVHENFIKESQSKSSSERTDVFVSYSRTDGDIARKLNESLQIAGKTTWFDQESIASGADFQKEIYEGIQNADNIVFILSPESILSPYCADEVEFAQKIGKRFVTLLYREINPEELHTALSAVQWIDFRPNSVKFENQFSEVLRTLDTDREHVQAHTKWQNEAMEWANFDKNKDFLLRGNELSLANTWIEEARESKKIPFVTDLQEEYLKESLREEKKAKLSVEKNKQIFIITIAIILAIAVLAGSQWYKSYQNQRELAIKNLIFEADNTVEFAPDKALDLSYEAYSAKKNISLVAIRNFYHIIEGINLLPSEKKLFFDLKTDDTILSVVAAKDKSSFIAIGEKELTLFDKTGNFISKIDKEKNYYKTKIKTLKNYNTIDPEGIGIEGAKKTSPFFVALSDNGEYIITHSDNNEINLFDKNGNKIRVITKIDSNLEVKINFLEKNEDLQVVIAEGMFYEYYPDNITIFNTLGNIIEKKTEIKWGNEPYTSILNKWTEAETQVIIESKFLKKELRYILNENYSLVKNGDTEWILNYVDYSNTDNNTITHYNFPENSHFSVLDSTYFLLYNQNVVNIFLLPHRIKPVFEHVMPLSSTEKINYQTATIDDYLQTPLEAANIISKILSFLTVFLLSLLVFNYMNYLTLQQRYFKVIIYLIAGFFVGLGWIIFILDEEYIVRVSFFSAISLSVLGIYYGKIDIKKRLYINGFLYIFVSVLLILGAIFIFYYIGSSLGYQESFAILFGLINLLIALVVIVSWFAIEKASTEFSQRNFTYFSDWLSIVVFAISFYIIMSVTKLDFDFFALSLVILFPTTYLIRTLIHHLVLHNYKKTPYSLTVLRSYVPLIVLLPALIVGLIMNDTNIGFNYVLAISAISNLVYIPLLYLLTIFVAYKQKDTLNLRINFFFWWTTILLIFVSILVKEGGYFTFFAFVIFWLIPIFWWINRYRKKTKLNNNEEVLIKEL